MSCILNSFKGGYIGDSRGELYRGYRGGYSEFRLPKPPKVCKIIALKALRTDQQAIILHTLGVQV